MGVAGSGKTTLGRLLADELGRDFLDADDLHTDAAKAAMAAGRPLTDDDRAPWLAAVADWLAAHPDGIVACSALRRRYRDVLRGTDPLFAFLDGDRAVLRERLAARRGHFMPAGMLDSQLATLESPGPDERAVRVDIAAEPAAQVETVVAAL